MLVTAGSPPRLRGIQSDEPTIEYALRFTPAPAGNTVYVEGLKQQLSVHPRACGEYSLPQRDAVKTPGSPPRLRGIPEFLLAKLHVPRFTPAPAGNTSGAA